MRHRLAGRSAVVLPDGDTFGIVGSDDRRGRRSHAIHHSGSLLRGEVEHRHHGGRRGSRAGGPDPAAPRSRASPKPCRGGEWCTAGDRSGSRRKEQGWSGGRANRTKRSSHRPDRDATPRLDPRVGRVHMTSAHRAGSKVLPKATPGGSRVIGVEVGTGVGRRRTELPRRGPTTGCRPGCASSSSRRPGRSLVVGPNLGVLVDQAPEIAFRRQPGAWYPSR